MQVSDLDFEFSQEQIALTPAIPRSAARMLVVDRSSAESVIDSHFLKLSDFLKSGDILVVNQTTVLRARFFARKNTGGSLEGLYLKSNSRGVKVWLKGRVKVGDVIELNQTPGVRLGSGLKVKVIEKNGKEAVLQIPDSEFKDYLAREGTLPIPPYIGDARRRQSAGDSRVDAGATDSDDYQTIFANAAALESVAAPTASLHFDQALMESLKTAGVSVEKICLSVGAGTFAPIETETVEAHPIHAEDVEIDEAVWQRLAAAQAEGRRIIAVGTTVVRSLESAARLAQEQQLEFKAGVARFGTGLFIIPPFKFEVVDGLITNFHWPRSSLLALVAAFMEPNKAVAGKWRDVYEYAVRQKYRLFSYGDGILIL